MSPGIGYRKLRSGPVTHFTTQAFRPLLDTSIKLFPPNYGWFYFPNIYHIYIARAFLSNIFDEAIPYLVFAVDPTTDRPMPCLGVHPLGLEMATLSR